MATKLTFKNVPLLITGIIRYYTQTLTKNVLHSNRKKSKNMILGISSETSIGKQVSLL